MIPDLDPGAITNMHELTVRHFRYSQCLGLLTALSVFPGIETERSMEMSSISIDLIHRCLYFRLISRKGFQAKRP